MLVWHFKVKFEQCAASCMVTIDFKLADIKLESAEAYLQKLGENLSQDFEVI